MTCSSVAPVEPPEAPSAQRWLEVPLVVLVIVAVGMTIYANSFSGAFLLDDRKAIMAKAELWSSQPIWQVMRLHEQTPVLALTLAGNYRLGGLNPWGYHLVNLAIHLLAALTLFGIVRRTLLSDRLRERFGSAAAPLGALTALLWMAHPIQTESVTYVIQRKESLMGLFYLLTLYCAIRGHDSPRGRWWQLAGVAACALGMGTKQVMVTAPVVVLLYDRTLLSGSFRKALVRSCGFYVLLAATWLVLRGSVQRFQEEGLGVAARDLGPWQYGQTQFGVILHYLRLSFWPAGLCLDYFDWPVARAPGQFLLPGAVVLGMVAASALLLFWRGRGLGFLGAWFFLVLAPTSSVIVVTELAVEHRMYLPLAGVAALVVAGGYAAGQALLERLAVPARRCRWLGWTMGGLGGVLVCVLGYLTIQRNADYRSEIVMAQDAVRKRPGNARAHTALGTHLMLTGDTTGALAEFSTAIALSPDYPDAYNNRGVAYQHLQRYDQAIRDYDEAIALQPNSPDLHNNRGRAYAGKGQYARAIEEYTRAIELEPGYAEAYYNRAVAREASGQLLQASQDYRKAVELDPGLDLGRRPGRPRTASTAPTSPEGSRRW